MDRFKIILKSFKILILRKNGYCILQMIQYKFILVQMSGIARIQKLMDFIK